MEGHLFEAQHIWKSECGGAWLSIDFAKAFNSTSHSLMQFFLEYLIIPGTWCTALIQIVKDTLRFLVGNQPSEAVLQPGTSIKQGDTLLPTIFSLHTAVLIQKVLKRLP